MTHTRTHTHIRFWAQAATQAQTQAQDGEGEAGPSQARASGAAGGGAGAKKLSKGEKEATLRMLVSDGWLAFAPDRQGFLSLGVGGWVGGCPCGLVG